MGLFSDIFGSGKSTDVTIPGFAMGPTKSYAGSVGNFLKRDPYSLVAPASGLQNQAFGQASHLGQDWRPAMTDALGAVKAAGAAPAANAGTAAQATPASAALTSAYSAPDIGNAAQAGGGSIAPVERINGSSLLDNLQSYMDPATQALVDSTMADYNHSAEQARAAQQARLAGQGAWGSGGQFYMSNFDVDNALKGANLENQLRSQAFSQAINASNSDAARRQDASSFNAGAFNNRATNQAQLSLQKNMFNAGAQNDLALAQAQLDAQAGQFNAGQANDMSMFNTGQANNLGMFNTGQSNNMAQYNAGLQNDQLARSLQAAGMQGDVVNSLAGNSRGDTMAMGTLGDMQHGIDQAYAQAPLTQLLAAGQAMQPLTATYGQNQTSTPSLFNTALSLGSLFASDRRLKINIRRLGEWDNRGDGLGKYEWNWKAAPNGEKVVGVIADEVEKLRPHAFVPNFVGQYAGVNYGAL